MYFRKFIYILLLCFLSACQEPSFHQVLAGADSMTIYFYPEGNQKDTLTVNLPEFQFIKEFMQTVSDEKSAKSCKKTGKIIFHKVRAKEDITSAEFSLNPSCAEIIYDYKNKKYSRNLSKLNLNFLLSVQKNWKIIKGLEESDD